MVTLAKRNFELKLLDKFKEWRIYAQAIEKSVKGIVK